MTRFFYFLSSAALTTALFNSIATASRYFPAARTYCFLFLGSVVAIAFVAAWFHDEPEEALRIWGAYTGLALLGVLCAFK